MRPAPSHPEQGHGRLWAVVATVVVASTLAACSLEDGSHLGEAADDARGGHARPGPSVEDPPEPPDWDLGTATYEPAACPILPPLGVEMTCGTLAVDRDRDHPAEGRIQLAVARLHSESETPSPVPVVYLEGGPGGAALVSADWWAGHPVLDERDLILIDQRGTGWSKPNLGCEPELETDEGLGALAACAGRLERQTDLSDFATRDAAADIAELGMAMGYEQVDLWAISYGTRLAMVTITEYPEAVRAAVLDSVYPPGVEALEEQAGNGERAFDELFSACAADPACSERYGDLQEAMEDAMESLDAETPWIEWFDPWTGESTSTEVTGQDLVDAVFAALYDSLIIPDIPRAISLAGSEDKADVESGFSLLSGVELYGLDRQGVARGEPSSDSDGLYYSVTCSEEMPITDLPSIREAGRSVDPAFREELISGAEFDLSVCKIWDAGQDSAAALAPVSSRFPPCCWRAASIPSLHPAGPRRAWRGWPTGSSSSWKA